MTNFLDKLLGLLIQMNLKPKSGYGRTEIIWEDGRIVSTAITTREHYK